MTDDVAHEPGDFEHLYDASTRRAIDQGGARSAGRSAAGRSSAPSRSVGGWRGAAVAGVLHAALAGAGEALDVTPGVQPVVEVRPERPDTGDGAVRLVFVPHAPTLSRAIVRPHLL